MPVANYYSAVKPNNDTEITVYGDGSINIEVDTQDGNFTEVDLTLAQLKTLVKEAEKRKKVFTNK